MILCQNIIADQYTEAGIFYDQMNNFLAYGFNDPDIRFLSCGCTNGMAKKACGFYPINYSLTDEFRWVSFSPLKTA
ncbi:MAG: hypothetical protein KJ737_05245 [Proteobacteria bacterium]|nr:hypothetical protein [Pseudomonadota bacterium]